jgi:hypothetical protein
MKNTEMISSRDHFSTFTFSIKSKKRTPLVLLIERGGGRVENGDFKYSIVSAR